MVATLTEPSPARDRERYFSAESQAFLAWLRPRMKARGFGENQSKLAVYLGTGSATVNGWFTRGTLPSRKLWPGLARVLGEPVEEVWRVVNGPAAADAQDDASPPPIPGFLAELLAQMTPFEQEVAAESLRGLLRLREEHLPFGRPPTERPAGSEPQPEEPRDRPTE